MASLSSKFGLKPEHFESDENQEDEFEPITASERFGLNPDLFSEAKTHGKKSIAEDIKESLLNTPSALVSALGAVPGEVVGTFKHPERIPANIPAGIAEGLEGALNIPHNIAQYGAAKGIPGAESLLEHLPYSERVGLITQALMGNNQPGDVLVRGLSGFAPYSRLGKAASGLKGVGTRAAQGATYATGQNQNPVEAAAAGLLGEAIPHGAGALTSKAAKGIKSLHPANIFKSPLSPEELEESLRITKGTTTPLGSVVQNPRLQKLYENVLQNVPLSGATKNLEEIGKHLKGKGERIFSEMETGANPENLGAAIKKALKESYSETQAQKESLYSKANELAEKHKVNVGRENTSKKAGAILEDIKESPELASTFDKGARKVIAMLANPKAENSYKLSNVFKGKLNDMASQAYMAGKKHEGNLLKSLSKALEEDIEHSISETKAPGLKEAHVKAQKFYGEQYAPFNEKKIKQFLNEGADTDTIINSFLPKSRATDRATLLSKLTSKLSPENLKLVPQAYFRPAMVEGTLNIPKLVGLWKDLGPRQRKALFPEKDTYKQFEDYIKLAEKNPEATSLMANPKTGVRNTQILGLAAGLSGLAKTIGVPLVAGKLATKALTHEGIREKFVKKLIEKAKAPEVKNKSKAQEMAKKLANSKNIGKLTITGNVQQNKEKERG